MSLKEVRNKGKADGKLRIVVDGYNAPLTAGNFVDLVDKKFYDGMDIQRADGFVVQTGDPGTDVSHASEFCTVLSGRSSRALHGGRDKQWLSGRS